jgi:2-polyprenyl-6-methoxyphenol hydroxylase-like FAD-dependent oxidoreductase
MTGLDDGRQPAPAPSGTDRTAVVIGASMAGLFAAAALAHAGYEVTLLDRDRLPQRPASRRGVPQDEQAHILLYRGLTVIEELLPGFRADLRGHGAVSSDAGEMPWLSEHGWLESSRRGLEVLSATRPLLEAVVRIHVLRHPLVRLSDGVTVNGLHRRVDGGWAVHTEVGGVEAAVVVDASGRSSRLPEWLPELGHPPEQRVDARVGYSSRLFAERGSLPVRAGIMIISAPQIGTAGLALPVEHGRWLVAAAGFGDRRPPRDEEGYDRFLAGLRDPAIADLTAVLEPISPVRIHRQTSNHRRLWHRVAGWPDGLLVVGDALCAFDPIYGQGITVAAQQGRALEAALHRGRRVDRRLQRELSSVTEIPWSIATTADLRSPSCQEVPTPVQRISMAWTNRLAILAASGHPRATDTLSSVNHLMAPPAALLHPALLYAGCRRLPTERLPRPAVVEELSRVRRERQRADPAGA